MLVVVAGGVWERPGFLCFGEAVFRRILGNGRPSKAK